MKNLNKLSDNELVELIRRLSKSEAMTVIDSIRRLAYDRLASGAFETVLRVCQAALDLCPACEEFHVFGAKASMHLGNSKEALVQISNVSIWEDRPSSWVSLKGDILYDRGNYADALKAYEFCLSIDPNNFRAKVGKAGSFLSMRRYQEALDEFNCITNDGKLLTEKEVVNEGYSTDYLRLCLAESEMGVGQLQSAMVRCCESLKSSPNNGQAFWLRAQINLKLRAFEDALLDAKRAAELLPHSSQALRVIGDILGWQEKYDEAISLYSQSIKLAPTNSSALLGRANCYFNKEQWQESLKDFKKLASLGWNTGDVTEAIAELEYLLS